MPIPILTSGGPAGANQPTTVILTVLGGIAARFASSVYLPTTFPNGISEGEVPDNTSTFPLLFVMHQGEIPEWNSEAEALERTLAQFQVFDVGTANVEAECLQLKNRFDWGHGYDLKMMGAATIDVTRKNYLIGPTEIRNQNGEVVHMGQVDYEFVIKRTPSYEP